MSFDLSVWYSSRSITQEEAEGIYMQLCDGDTSGVQAHEYVTQFLNEVTTKYPQIDDWPEDTIDDCPWNTAFDVSPAHVLMCVGWTHHQEIAPWVKSLARKYHLFCYDPQEHSLQLPNPEKSPKASPQKTSSPLNDTVEMVALDIEDGQLIHWKYDETITVQTVKRTLQPLKATSFMFGQAQKRFIDLRCVQRIQVPYKEIQKFAEARKRLLTSKAPLKTAVLLPENLDDEPVRCYQKLVQDTPIDVEVFHTLKDCAIYLDVKESVLS